MRISAAWAEEGVDGGRGVNVVHLDDGLDYTHEDLKDNYREEEKKRNQFQSL